jgi:hypothetical protein
MGSNFNLLFRLEQPSPFSLKVFGYDLNRSPTSAQVVNLLNLTNFFIKKRKEEEQI